MRDIGLGGLLTLIFLILKLCNVITWSWIWVLSPIWISIILYVVLFVLAYFADKTDHNSKSKKVKW